MTQNGIQRFASKHALQDHKMNIIDIVSNTLSLATFVPQICRSHEGSSTAP